MYNMNAVLCAECRWKLGWSLSVSWIRSPLWSVDCAGAEEVGVELPVVATRVAHPDFAV